MFCSMDSDFCYSQQSHAASASAGSPSEISIPRSNVWKGSTHHLSSDCSIEQTPHLRVARHLQLLLSFLLFLFLFQRPPSHQRVTGSGRFVTFLGVAVLVLQRTCCFSSKHHQDPSRWGIAIASQTPGIHPYCLWAKDPSPVPVSPAKLQG